MLRCQVQRPRDPRPRAICYRSPSASTSRTPSCIASRPLSHSVIRLLAYLHRLLTTDQKDPTAHRPIVFLPGSEPRSRDYVSVSLACPYE